MWFKKRGDETKLDIKIKGSGRKKQKRNDSEGSKMKG
jgi:hypothetical protein